MDNKLKEKLSSLTLKTRIAYIKWETDQNKDGQAVEDVLVAEAIAAIKQVFGEVLDNMAEGTHVDDDWNRGWDACIEAMRSELRQAIRKEINHG